MGTNPSKDPLDQNIWAPDLTEGTRAHKSAGKHCFKERTGSLQHNDHSKACACTQCDAAKQNLLASIAEALIWIAMLAPAVTL